MTSVTPLPDLRSLDGRIVLLRSVRDQHHPPAGLRGTIEVTEDFARELKVKLVWEIPDMANEAAQQRSVVLASEASIRRLLASEQNGAYAFTLEQELSSSTAAERS